MEIHNEWIGCCEVTVFDWIDNENYYLHIDEYENGGSLSRPKRELSVLLRKNEHNKTMLQTRLNSIVNGLVWEKRYAKHWVYH